MTVELVPELGIGRRGKKVSSDALQPAFYARHGFVKVIV
jgi:hypothetical protein